MAIGIFKSLIFGDVNSADYGIYITGEAVYNAPERAVEMVTVPGRNGAIALDQGRWENIEVSYPAGCFGGDQSDFASKISDFRNAIVSQIGYQRLTDEYNPNEYRMAVYAEGLDVKPKSKGRAGEFTITFDCKPQRYLTSGETEITVESGDILTNPTQYDASPLLALKGYGDISFSGYSIELERVVIGEVTLAVGGRSNLPSPYTIVFNPNYVNTGDSMWFAGTHGLSFLVNGMQYSDGTLSYADSNPSITDHGKLNFYFDSQLFTAGTSKTITNTRTYTLSTYSGETATWTATVDYDGNDTFTFSGSRVASEHIKFNYPTLGPRVEWSTLTADSTVLALGDPTYIDCDLGEAYMISGGDIVSLNKYVALGSDLPTLVAGENTITYDNTFTEVKITPRWWKL